MRRRMLGIISALLVIGGAAGLVFGQGSDSQVGLFASACFRAGAVLGALWLAFPKLEEIGKKVSPKILITLLIAALAVAVRPQLFRFVVPLLAVLLVLHWFGVLLRPAASSRRRRS